MVKYAAERGKMGKVPTCTRGEGGGLLVAALAHSAAITTAPDSTPLTIPSRKP